MTIREFANITRNDRNGQISEMKKAGLIADLGDNVEAYFIALGIIDDDSMHCFTPHDESLSFSFKSSPDRLWGPGILSWGGPTSQHDLSDASLKQKASQGAKITKRLLNRDFATSLANLYPSVSQSFEYTEALGHRTLRYPQLFIKIGAHSDEAQARLVESRGLDDYRSLLAIYFCNTSKALNVDQA